MNGGMLGFPAGLLLGTGKLKSQEFLTSGVWKKPPNVESVYVFLVGGGGAGGGCDGTATASTGGGGGGEVVEKILSIRSDLTITIGAGGTGVLGLAGNNGSSSTITGGATLTALGGGGGGAKVGSGIPNTGSSIANSGGFAMDGYTWTGSGGCGHGGVAEFQGFPTSSTPTFYLSIVEAKYNSVSLYTSNGAANSAYNANGGAGYKGFAGGGGSGGTQGTSANGKGHSGGGNGSTNTTGGHAAANTGSGGGGVQTTSVMTLAGGNGGSGYCLIVWTE